MAWICWDEASSVLHTHHASVKVCGEGISSYLHIREGNEQERMCVREMKVSSSNLLSGFTAPSMVAPRLKLQPVIVFNLCHTSIMLLCRI